ncbi:unnamed protein product [Rotaria sp. Silwood1]|nr:unnamed protein product [Rotaria sp. Silwood1]
MAERQAVFCSNRVGIRIRNALNIIIYIRALSLKSTSSEKINTGQILNLITSDTFKFEELYTNLAGLTASILETIILFGLLCWIIHPIPVLCGYALCPIFILIQIYFGRKFRQCREIAAVCSDKRMQAYSEFIYGCHTVKMYNWEKPMENRIVQMRKNELESIRYTSRFRAFNRTQYFISTQLLSLATFGSAWLLGYPLTIANTFPLIMAFAFMRDNIACWVPLAFEKFNEAKLASKRIHAFMHLTVKQEHQSSTNTLLSNQKQKGSIVMSNAWFSWQNDISCLSSLNLSVEKGTLVGIVGPVGCGKSSLLAAILGEMNLIEGQVNTYHSSFSYAAQSPWIFADTFRNNILLNRPYDAQRYRDVIDACCLNVDLSRLGSCDDLAIIGDNGVNLSGGQKARVGLARALYDDADIYLLDDPLSAVDRTVAEHIYERCIGSNGLLKNKTRLLLTHQTQFLFEADQIIFLSHGQIDKEDRLDENFTRQNEPDKKQTSVLTTMLEDNPPECDEQSIITDEISVNDRSNWSLYYDLFTALPSGICGLCVLIVLLLLGEIFNDGANYWLSIWLKQSKIDRQFSPKYAYIYFGLIIGALVMDILEFFESNPSGRILNRASKEQYAIDELLPVLMLNGIMALLITVGAMFILCGSQEMAEKSLKGSMKATAIVAMSNYLEASSIVAGAGGLSLWIDYLHLNPVEVGILGAVSANGFGSAAGALVGGFLVDRFGRKIGVGSISLAVPTLILKIGFKLCGSMMIGFLIIHLIIGFLLAPDTRGKTLHEIEMAWYGTKKEHNPTPTTPLATDKVDETTSPSPV